MTRHTLAQRPVLDRVRLALPAQSPELLALGPNLKHLVAKNHPRVLSSACRATNFAVPDALHDERDLLRLEQDFGGGLLS